MRPRTWFTYLPLDGERRREMGTQKLARANVKRKKEIARTGTSIRLLLFFINKTSSCVFVGWCMASRNILNSYIQKREVNQFLPNESLPPRANKQSHTGKKSFYDITLKSEKNLSSLLPSEFKEFFSFLLFAASERVSFHNRWAVSIS